MTPSDVPLAPPRLRNLFAETRLPLELALGLLRDPVTAALPRGEGQAVLVLPGFGASDFHTGLLRSRLNRLGYRASGWGLGKNHGRVPKLLPGVIELLSAAPQPVTLVGWSLGGVIAREAARKCPDKVRRLVTLGSPVVGGAKYTVFAGQYRKQGYDLDELERAIDAREARALPCPVTAVYTRSDGIVGWGSCIDRWHPQVRHVEVRASHMGLAVDAGTFAVIARALAGGYDAAPTT